MKKASQRGAFFCMCAKEKASSSTTIKELAVLPVIPGQYFIFAALKFWF